MEDGDGPRINSEGGRFKGAFAVHLFLSHSISLKMSLKINVCILHFEK